ncbi:hypothetical protein CCACVL1_04585 [Corchorus capsularis]|uniref:Uncharacterized protein n=1 Tax=Corchorus capsularis TaxID=210143 RepID=A0A1R3JRA9_COCAP|nr:hypothetical protein CCACVL1_04585 [Corchorus capsularis]
MTDEVSSRMSKMIRHGKAKPTMRMENVCVGESKYLGADRRGRGVGDCVRVVGYGRSF